MTDTAQEIRRRANVLAWTHNWKARARAAELALEAQAAGQAEEAKLWNAVEAALMPL